MEERSGIALSLFLPVFLDVEVPLPRQVVCLVVVSEAGLDVVAAADHHALGRFLHRGHELVLLCPWTVASHHVHCLVHWKGTQNGRSVACMIARFKDALG